MKFGSTGSLSLPIERRRAYKYYYPDGPSKTGEELLAMKELLEAQKK